MATGKTILITRSHDDGNELREAIVSAGHRVFHEPLTQVVLNHTARLPLSQLLAEDPDAVLISSRYGARALATLTEVRDISLLCVGQATVEIAESLGFMRIAITGQTAEDMANYIVDAYDHDAKLVHVCGVHTHPALQQQLRQFGYGLAQVAAYEAVASETLSDILKEQLRRQQIDAVVLMSERTARLWLELLGKAELPELATDMKVYAISEQASAPLRAAGWSEIEIAAEPTLDSLIETITRDAA